jgi:hypothetical protein
MNYPIVCPFTWTIARTKNSATIISFLEELLVMQYLKKRMILVMDNAANHVSKNL